MKIFSLMLVVTAWKKVQDANMVKEYVKAPTTSTCRFPLPKKKSNHRKTGDSHSLGSDCCRLKMVPSEKTVSNSQPLRLQAAKVEDSWADIIDDICVHA